MRLLDILLAMIFSAVLWMAIFFAVLVGAYRPEFWLRWLQ